MAKHIQVILLESVRKLGQKGEIIPVSPGYARNYLLPQKIAVLATKEALAKQEQTQQKMKLEKEKEYELLQPQLQQIKDNGVDFPALSNEQGQLFGSITTDKVKKALEDKYHFNFDNKEIKYQLTIVKDSDQKQAIGHIGTHQVLLAITNLSKPLQITFNVVVKPLKR